MATKKCIKKNQKNTLALLAISKTVGIDKRSLQLVKNIFFFINKKDGV